MNGDPRLTVIQRRQDYQSWSNQEWLAVELTEASSTCALPPKIYNSPLPAGCSKPAGLEGFVDMDHLRLIAARSENIVAESAELSVLVRDLQINNPKART